MAPDASYTPVFRGQWPADARARWAAIRTFLDAWCEPGAAPPPESLEGDGPLTQAARERCGDALSDSVRSWLALVERAEASGAPQVRDCPAFDPVEDHFDDPAVRDATAVLVSGEQDVFWAVANARLADDDPPVEVFQQYDPSHPALVGRNGSVSEFALKYLCVYNEFAAGNREWFSADGADEDVRAARDWFEYALVLDSDDGWCGPLAIFERADAVAIVRDRRLQVSLFRDPAALELPPFLEAEMNRHLELRRRCGAS